MSMYTISDKKQFPKSCGIYCIRNVVNNKVLVGQTLLPFKNRWNIHVNSLLKGSHENPHLQYAFHKYNKDAFRFEVLEETNGDLNDREVWWINHLMSQNPSRGYNIRDGGSHGKMSETSRQKMSLARRGISLSEVHKNHISDALKGNTNALGNKLTDEQKDKIRLSKMGDNNPSLRIDVRQKISESAKERYRNKQNHPMFGQHLSCRHRQILSQKSSKTYAFTTPSGNPTTITNLSKFCEANGLDVSSMYKLHNGTYRCLMYKGWSRSEGQNL